MLVFDNSDLNRPFRLVAVYDGGQRQFHDEPVPEWLATSALRSVEGTLGEWSSHEDEEAYGDL